MTLSTGKLPAATAVDPSHIWVCGLEGHLDSPRFGNAYVGYAHLDAQRVLSLSDGLQTIQSANGLGLTQNYLNPTLPYLSRATALVPGSQGDNGKIDTVLFQYMVRLASLMELPATGRDLTVAVFGMFNHVSGDKLQDNKTQGSQDKIKVGAEAQYSFWRYMTAGLRVDRVAPNGGNSELAYSALSPRLVFHSNWLSREYFLLSYTRYFLGSGFDTKGFPDPTNASYSFVDLASPSARYPVDKNLLVFSANIAF